MASPGRTLLPVGLVAGYLDGRRNFEMAGFVRNITNRIAACALAAVLLPHSAVAAPPAAPADAPRLVVMDNDFAGPGGPDIQPLLFLLASPSIRLLGCTVVTGDGWVREETAHLLRFLEIAHADAVPVASGAEMPLLDTRARMKLREKLYGRIPWKGAWNDPGVEGAHPDAPELVRPWAEGLPHRRPLDEDAAHFLIRTVHAHPHRVTILAAGPLTNLALAIRLDPTFAATAGELVFMGGLLDTNLLQVTGNADFNSDFNFLFDPEAAHIVLTAPWARITGVGRVSNGVLMTPELQRRLAAAGTPAAAYLARHALTGLPLWDEMAAAIVADPTLVGATVTAPMDVDIADGPDEGRAHVWPADLAPGLGERPVRIVQSVDTARMAALFLHDAAVVGR